MNPPLPGLAIGAPGCAPGRGPGSVPQATPATLEKIGQFVDRLVDPETTLDLIIGRTRLLLLKTVLKRVQVAREEIADYGLIGNSELLIQGKQVGDTVLTLWFTDPKDKDKETTLAYLVRVYPDPDARERLERTYKALEDQINRFFCNNSIHLTLLGDKVAVSGTVKDVAEGTQILRIIRANLPGSEINRALATPPAAGAAPPAAPVAVPGAVPGLPAVVPGVPPGLLPPDDISPAPATAEAFQAAGGSNIINLLKVPGEQQVMLRVTVAEINRTAARSIGLNFSVINSQGVTVFSNTTGSSSSGFGSFGNSGVGGSGLGGIGGGFIPNITANLGNGRVPLAINALRVLNYAHSLAESTLTTLNGQTANFQAGGQFSVPVTTGTTFAGLQGVQFIPFGVQVSFTPFITDTDRIRLSVRANVSTRDGSTGTNIGDSNVSGLSTRNFNTTVELREGETLAVAGLIQNNLGAQSQRVPFLGEIPFVGQLTGLTQTTAGEQELVILVTPVLTHPMAPGQVPPLPGSDLFEPSDFEFYVIGRMESHCPEDYRSPIRTDLSRALEYRKAEKTYLSGPCGYSIGP
jgi:pilus assembly protein CpaC